jgi:hypothetical protein
VVDLVEPIVEWTHKKDRPPRAHSSESIRTAEFAAVACLHQSVVVALLDLEDMGARARVHDVDVRHPHPYY